ncbi:copper amine oxidase N-terminal domain-containing protein [Paenibacillus sp. 32O-W]|uniref:copper amine oxidase N-terminal domain-containing protein n=1 Tax=Paenibacillus sp. 32O-W TaxID=1695218 RepID=UPI0011A13B1C|nr:copper amine oxidase N-terminal domain-containing protein [Paenibacillus sp. 32O-W]
MVVRKKLGRAVLSAVIAGSVCSGVPALAAENASAASVQQAQFEEVNVTIDGVLQKFPQSAILYKGSTMVPMRGVFEALKAEVKWDGATQTVTATKGDTTIKLTIGNNYAYVNDQKVALTAEAIIVNGSTMVPLRFVAEALGAKVEWDGATKTAIISQGSEIKPGSGVTNPAQNQTNPAQNQQDPAQSSKKYVYNGIDATETKGRLYGTENQKEYDAVLKIAKEALADLDSIPVPQGMIDVLYNGKSFSPNQRAKTIYEVELMGATQGYKPLLDAGISPDTIVKAYKIGQIVIKLTNTTSMEVEEESPGVSSAYDALVEGQIDCDSLANTYALFYDLAGFETGIVRNGFHAFVIVKYEDHWVRSGKVLDLPSYFKEHNFSWYTRPDSINWDINDLVDWNFWD